MTTDPEASKRWLKIVSFLLFLVYILAGVLAPLISELFGMYFDAILGKAIIDHTLAHFFQTLPGWIWAAVSLLGLCLAWLLIKIQMAATGGSVPVKTVILVAVIPVLVIVFEVFAFIAPTQEIVSRFDEAVSPPGAAVIGEQHDGHDHDHPEGDDHPEETPTEP